MKETLLPCPFCGGEVRLSKQIFDRLDNPSRPYVFWRVVHRCKNGNYSETKYCGTKTEAIRNWNRRFSQNDD